MMPWLFINRSLVVAGELTGYVIGVPRLGAKIAWWVMNALARWLKVHVLCFLAESLVMFGDLIAVIPRAFGRLALCLLNLASK